MNEFGVYVESVWRDGCIGSRPASRWEVGEGTDLRAEGCLEGQTLVEWHERCRGEDQMGKRRKGGCE